MYRSTIASLLPNALAFASAESVVKGIAGTGVSTSSSSVTVSRSAAGTTSPSSSSIVTRRYLSSDSSSNITLYQYQICPFCNYAKAMLAYTDTPYKHVEVNPLTKAELKWSEDYKKVPVAQHDTENSDGRTTLKGSDDIVESILDSAKPHLQSKFSNTNMTVEEFANGNQSQHWVAFAKDDLAPLLYPNLCNTISNSYDAFDYVNTVPTFTSMQRIMIQYVGSLAMYMAASKIKSKRNIVDEVQALEDALQVLEDGLKDGNGNADLTFLSKKDQPCLGDIAVYGVLQGLEGLAVHEQVIGSRENSTIPDWYKRMTQEVHGS